MLQHKDIPQILNLHNVVGRGTSGGSGLTINGSVDRSMIVKRNSVSKGDLVIGMPFTDTGKGVCGPYSIISLDIFQDMNLDSYAQDYVWFNICSSSFKYTILPYDEGQWNTMGANYTTKSKELLSSGVDGVSTKIFYIDHRKYLVITKSSIFYLVISNDGTTFTKYSTTTFAANSRVDAISLGSNKFLIMYDSSSSPYYNFVVLTLDTVGNSISLWTPSSTTGSYMQGWLLSINGEYYCMWYMNGYKFTRLTVSGTTITPGTETTITAPSPNDNINRIYGIIPFDTTYSVLIIQSGNSVSSFRFQLLKRTASNTFSIIAQNVPTQEYMLPAITGNYNNHSWCKFGTNRFAFVAIRTDGNFGDGIMRMLNFYVDTTNEKIIQKGFWDPNLAFGTTNNSYNYPLLKNITNGPSFMLFYSDQITNTNCYIIDMYGSNGDNNWSCVKLLSSDKDLYHLRNGVATTDTNAGSSATIKLFENY